MRAKRVNREKGDFSKLVNDYHKQLFLNDPSEKRKLDLELEVKMMSNGRSLITRLDYDNVVKKIKSLGYICRGDPEGTMLLRMSPEEINKTGRLQTSNIRAELTDVKTIQEYCKTNDLQKLFDEEGYLVKLVEKTNWIRGKRMESVVNDDFNFKMDLRAENTISPDFGRGQAILEKWKDCKKSFRLINRVRFIEPFSTGNKNPCSIDVSIIKKQYKTCYTIQESKLFSLPESFEIEIEVRNYVVKEQKFDSENTQMYIKKTIQDVLGGIQNSDFPISNTEQRETLEEYYRIITKKDDYSRIYNTSNFIGPSSVTLHLKHIIEPNENNSFPNIRSGYTVTDKTDGERCLMFISKGKKIYFIDNRLNVMFTGCKLLDDEFVECIIDGEYVATDKNMNMIQSYYAFDIYFSNAKDVRFLPFYSLEYMEDKEKYEHRVRHSFLSELFQYIKIGSIVEDEPPTTQFFMKTFYPQKRNQNIFECCYEIKRKEEKGGFLYEIDGLIFTPMELGVGEEKINGTIPQKKTTWWHSLKWKPEKYNSIDFLVTTRKNEGGGDLLTPIFQDGLALDQGTQIQFYKTFVLRCGYNEKNHGYLNPCQSLLENKLVKRTENEEEYKPVQFYPTEPSDSNAGIANFIADKDSKGTYVVKSQDMDVVQDNTVVEFYYDKTRQEGWRWIPLRIRYDKTAEYRNTGKRFGNDYSIANDNWHSIHYPVTEEMIFRGEDIPTFLEVDENVYYNTNTLNHLQGLRDFHNLVKKRIIKSVSKKGYNLIDYACGKAGDLPKWIFANLSFIFGIDISKDNLENKKNGCCARYLNEKERHHNLPGVLFVNGDSRRNIKSTEAMMDAKSKMITKAVFGEIQDKGLDNMVHRYYGVGKEGFDISSCQFAIHYFFENKETLHNFLRNVSECTRVGGYFIGTCYDGQTIFNELRDKSVSESIGIYEKKKIWSITKEYAETEFVENNTSLGYKILVYQESINKLIPEYLVNFDYLQEIMTFYGFSLLSTEEANDIGLPNGSAMFKQLYGKDSRMNANEKKISFLNRYFIFRKNVNVNAKQVAESYIREEITEEYENRFADEVVFGGPEVNIISEIEALDIKSKPKTPEPEPVLEPDLEEKLYEEPEIIKSVEINEPDAEPEAKPEVKPEVKPEKPKKEKKKLQVIEPDSPEAKPEAKPNKPEKKTRKKTDEPKKKTLKKDKLENI